MFHLGLDGGKAAHGDRGLVGLYDAGVLVAVALLYLRQHLGMAVNVKPGLGQHLEGIAVYVVPVGVGYQHAAQGGLLLYLGQQGAAVPLAARRKIRQQAAVGGVYQQRVPLAAGP